MCSMLNWYSMIKFKGDEYGAHFQNRKDWSVLHVHIFIFDFIWQPMTKLEQNPYLDWIYEHTNHQFHHIQNWNGKIQIILELHHEDSEDQNLKET